MLSLLLQKKNKTNNNKIIIRITETKIKRQRKRKRKGKFANMIKATGNTTLVKFTSLFYVLNVTIRSFRFPPPKNKIKQKDKGNFSRKFYQNMHIYTSMKLIYSDISDLIVCAVMLRLLTPMRKIMKLLSDMCCSMNGIYSKKGLLTSTACMK